MEQATKKKKIFDDRYEILSIVGRGSCSVVYHARYIKEPDREVALKVLINKQSRGPLDELLRKEALAMVSARHKNVIQLNDFHSVDGISYLSMEFALEGSLKDYVAKKAGKLPADIARSFMTQSAEALNFLHQSGITHRDIKPDNILALNDSEIRLADFGVAILPGENTSLKDLQAGIGTMDYMPPEVLTGHKCDELTDLYSLGLTFFELVTNYHPFHGKPLAQMLEARKSDFMPDLLRLAPSVPYSTLKLISRSLSFDRKDRVSSFAELLHLLQSPESDKGRPEAPQPRFEVIESNSEKASKNTAVTLEEKVPEKEIATASQIKNNLKHKKSEEVKTTSESDAETESVSDRRIKARKKIEAIREKRRQILHRAENSDPDNKDEIEEQSIPKQVAVNDSADEAELEARKKMKMKRKRARARARKKARLAEQNNQNENDNIDTLGESEETTLEQPQKKNEAERFKKKTTEKRIKSEKKQPKSEKDSDSIMSRVVKTVEKNKENTDNKAPQNSGRKTQKEEKSGSTKVTAPAPAMLLNRKTATEPEKPEEKEVLKTTAPETEQETAADKPELSDSDKKKEEKEKNSISPEKLAEDFVNTAQEETMVYINSIMEKEEEESHMSDENNDYSVQKTDPAPSATAPVKKRSHKTEKSPLMMIATIVIAVLACDFLLNMFTDKGLRHHAVEIISPEPAPAVLDFSFPYLPEGVYHGQIKGLSNSSHSLTVLSLPETNELVYIIGMKGWTPVKFNLADMKAGQDVKIASNGQILSFKGQVNNGTVEGTFTDIVTMEQGTWNLSIQ